MNRISSKATRWYKKGFPTLWFGFLGIFIISGLHSGAAKQSIAFLIVPAAMGAFGYFLMRVLIWDLVDEVIDLDASLLIKNGSAEMRVPLSDIVNISTTMFMNPPRVVLKLRTLTFLGKSEIAFSPSHGVLFNPFAKSKVAEDLILRVDRTRGR